MKIRGVQSSVSHDSLDFQEGFYPQDNYAGAQAHRLPRESVQSQSLKVFKIQLVKSLSIPNRSHS